MPNRAARIWMFLTVVMLVAAAFSAGVATRKASLYGWAAQLAQLVPGLYEEQPDTQIPPATDLRPLATFWEVREKILSNFVYPLDDPTKLTYGAVKGMLASLDDPYSRFLDPKEYDDFNRETEGSFEGIGAWMGQEKAADGTPRVVIMAIIPEGPAAKTDLRPGDQVMAVNDTPTQDMNLQQVVDLIRGPAGQSVKIVVKREGQDKAVEVEIVRAQVDVPVVESKVLDGNIGYLWLRSFNKQADREVKQALEQLLAKNIQGLVLDLSIDGGGLLEEAIKVGSLFFSDGPIVYVRERGGEPQPYTVVPGALVPPDLPLLVLVDQGTASASEIVAGALQDRGRARLVGQRTFGKSKVQTVIRLNDNSALILSTAVYLTPKLRDVGEAWPEDKTQRGLHPDVAFEAPNYESGQRYEDWHQQQVDRAAQMLREPTAAAAPAP